MRIGGSLRFWGRFFLRYAAMIVGFAFFWMIYMFLMHLEMFDGAELPQVLALDFYIAAFTVMMILTASYYQAYYPLLLSLNVTRKSCLLAVMGCQAALTLFVTVLEICMICMGKISFGAAGLCGAAGLLLGVAGVGLLSGAIICRYGIPGIFIVLVSVLLLGAAAIWAVVRYVLLYVEDGGAARLGMLACAGGIGLFLALGGMTGFLLRNQEVRR